MLEDKAYDKLKEEAESRADPEATRRLAAYAAPGAGRWLQAVPSRVIDMNLTNAALSTTLKLQFGVDVFAADGVCSFCGAVNDRERGPRAELHVRGRPGRAAQRPA